MRARTDRTALAVALCVAVSLAAGAAAARDARVDYVAGGSVYVNAGAADSVRSGDTLRVARRGGDVAALRVTVVSLRRAVCDTLWTHAALAIGDRVVLARAAAADTDSVAAPAPAVASPAPLRTRSGARPVRGPIGVHWLGVDAPAGRYRQPAVDLRLESAGGAGGHVGGAGGHVDAALDVRARRTSRRFAGVDPVDDLQSRVYRASVSLRTAAPGYRLTVGRQSAPTLASISLFDGALASWDGRHAAAGAFAGTQPDPAGLRLAGDIVESGGYAELHATPGAERAWSAVAGGVTSRDHGRPNRDFAFAQASWQSRGLVAFATQELDVNRGWKRVAGEPAVAPTATYAMLRARVLPALALTGGFDNRRSVRLWRDRLTPETEFDDRYRQGAWAGAAVDVAGRGGVAGEWRTNAGGTRSDAWSLTADARRFAPLAATLRARLSRWTGGGTDSRLASAELGLEPVRGTSVAIAGGVRSVRTPWAGDDREQWQSVDADASLGGRWLLDAGWERDAGGSAGDTRQLRGGISWRFR